MPVVWRVADVDTQSAIALLSESYKGRPAMCNLVGGLLELAGDKPSGAAVATRPSLTERRRDADVDAVIFNLMREYAFDEFEPARADRIFSEPVWTPIAIPKQHLARCCRRCPSGWICSFAMPDGKA